MWEEEECEFITNPPPKNSLLNVLQMCHAIICIAFSTIIPQLGKNVFHKLNYFIQLTNLYGASPVYKVILQTL